MGTPMAPNYDYLLMDNFEQNSFLKKKKKIAPNWLFFRFSSLDSSISLQDSPKTQSLYYLFDHNLMNHGLWDKSGQYLDLVALLL